MISLGHLTLMWNCPLTKTWQRHMNQQPPNVPSEPPKEVIDLLNKVDQGYIGHAPVNKPVLHFIDETEEDYMPEDAGN